MSGRVTSCCVALLLAVTCVSAVQRLDSINDLKKINFGQSVPKHSLLLLHWFANMVKINNNNVIRLTFDPNSDYGSHHYGNYERLLDPLPQGHRYFTVGNLNQDTSAQLPDYVVNPQTEYDGRNRDRIIIRVREDRIDRVFITQHYDTTENQGTPYDPAHTFRITNNLLIQIREFSLRDSHLPLLYLRNRYGSNADDNYLKNQWGHLACLGLFLAIVIEEKYSLNKRNNRPENNRSRNVSSPSRPENVSRPSREKSNRSVSNRSQVSNNNLVRSTPENTQSCCGCVAWAVGCFIIFFLVLVTVLSYISKWI